jgi:hypothetical protein
MKSGLSHDEFDIQSQTLSTLHSFMCHSKQMAIDYLKQNLQIIVGYFIIPCFIQIVLFRIKLNIY